MGKRIYAFIVGINEYPDPKDRLNGAVPDAGKIAKFLTDNFDASRLNIKTLLDGEATYQNFVDGFRAHLGQARKDDVVWFHYSGHGSRQPTATELESFTSGNMDETLVLVDSRPSGHDLADKELGLLLSEVEKGGAHILVSLDCCHSGSGTRSFGDPAPEYKTRLADDRKDARPLSSYLDGYFVKNGVNFPDQKHILLAACSRFQTAKETYTSSGVFTDNLISNLNKSGQDISYADLFVRLRQGIITNNIPDQDPQIELMGGTNGYVRFLDGAPSGGMKKFPVYQQNGTWVMGAGAIQGFQDAAEKNTEVTIFLDDSTEPFTTAVITSASFQKSVLAPQTPLDPKGKYWALPKNFPTPPDKIYFDGATESFSAFMEDLKIFPQMTAATETEKDIADAIIKETLQGFELWENQKRLLIATADKTDKAGPQKLLLLLDQVITWKRIISLQNPKTKIDPTQTTIQMEIGPAKGAAVTYDPGKIAFDEDTEYPYKLLIRNMMKQPLHYCALYLSADYGITLLRNEPLEALDTPTVFAGSPDDGTFSLQGQPSSNDTLIVIISTERTDDFELQSDPIELGASVSGTGTRGLAGINKYIPLKGEWFTSKFNIRIR